jgi:hypothetical protein
LVCYHCHHDPGAALAVLAAQHGTSGPRSEGISLLALRQQIADHINTIAHPEAITTPIELSALYRTMCILVRPQDAVHLYAGYDPRTWQQVERGIDAIMDLVGPDLQALRRECLRRSQEDPHGWAQNVWDQFVLGKKENLDAD